MTSSAATSGRYGPVYLAIGLSVSFAVAGTVLTLLLVSAGLDPELFRYVAAALLVAVGVTLVVRRVSDWVTLQLSTVKLRPGREATSAPVPLRCRRRDSCVVA